MTLKRLIDYNVERRTLQIPAGQNPQTVECLVNPDPCCGVSPGPPPAEVTAYPCNPAGSGRRKVLGLRVEKTIIPSLWLTKSDPTCTTNPFACCGGTDPGVTAGNGPVRGLTLEQTPLKTPAAGAYGSPSCSTPTNCCPPTPCPFPNGIPQFLTATLHRNKNLDDGTGHCTHNGGDADHNPLTGYIEGGPAFMVNIGGYRWRTDFTNNATGIIFGNPGDFDFDGINGDGGLYLGPSSTKNSPWWPCTLQNPLGGIAPEESIFGFWCELWYGDPPPLAFFSTLDPDRYIPVAAYQTLQIAPLNGSGVSIPGYYMWDDVDGKAVLVPPPQGWWFGLHIQLAAGDFQGDWIGDAVNPINYGVPEVMSSKGYTMPALYSMFRWPENFAQCVFLDNTNASPGGCSKFNNNNDCGTTTFGNGGSIFHWGGNDRFPCDKNYISCAPFFGSFGWEIFGTRNSGTGGLIDACQNLLIGA